MISNRQAKEREVRKEQILKGALKVFKQQGIEKSTMDEIAKQSDFGKHLYITTLAQRKRFLLSF